MNAGVQQASRRLGRYRIQISILAILIVLYTVFLVGNPGVFTRFDIYRAFMSTMPFFGLMALSATLVVTLGEIDLSFPSVLGISSWVLGTVFVASGSLPLALAACLLTGIFAGAINGLLVARVGIPSIVATIGTMFLWRGLVNVLAEGRGIALDGLRETAFYDLFVGRLFGLFPAQFLWFTAVALLYGLIYRRHRFGGHLLFVGDNAESARMMGIDVDRVKIICFMQHGLMAAFAGVLLACEVTYFWPSQGEGYLLMTLAAVFIGGTSVFGGKGTMFGTFIGVIIIGSLESGIISIGLTGFWVQFIYGLMITLSVSLYALLMKKQG